MPSGPKENAVKYVIGAPVHQRAWVLADWLAYLLEQDIPFDDTVLLVNYGESTDGTLDIIEHARDAAPWTVEVINSEAEGHLAERRWSFERYKFMARLRNTLLRRVRELEPDFYLSIDTDILLPPKSLKTLEVELRAANIDAISPLLYLTPKGTSYPNAMTLPKGRRPKVMNYTFRADAVFAAVLMSPNMYMSTDYAAHPLGEDIGWALNAARNGMTMGLCPHIKAKHVMNPEMLDVTDERVGF